MPWFRSQESDCGRMIDSARLWMAARVSSWRFVSVKSMVMAGSWALVGRRGSDERALRLGRREDGARVERAPELDGGGELVGLFGGHAAKLELLGVAHQFLDGVV